MNYTKICNLDDLVPYSGRCALVNNQQVALFRLDEGETIYAVGNYDPIGKANVLSRGLLANIDGVQVVASPLYKQHFNLKTGECLQEDVAIPVYQVKVEDGEVSVAV